MKCPKCGTEYEGQFCPNGCNAFKQCPVCGASYQGAFCPNGCNSAQAPKKKSKGCLIAAIVVAAVVVIVAGIIVGIIVGTGALLTQSVDDAIDEVVSTHSPDYQAPVVGINEAGTFEGRQITVTKVEKSNGTDFDTPAEGKEYVIVTVKIKNVGSDKFTYNPLDFKMRNSKGQVDTQAFTIIDSDTSLSSGELVAGGEVEGTIVFEQPKDDPELTLEFYDNVLFDDAASLEISLQ